MFVLVLRRVHSSVEPRRGGQKSCRTIVEVKPVFRGVATQDACPAHACPIGSFSNKPELVRKRLELIGAQRFSSRML